MAQKRMFSLKIVDTDEFLDMPLSSQCLYFHLGMRADDEGFVGNAQRVMRMIGCSPDDLKILIAKRFLINFENGVHVIKHWKINNYIQSDRFQPTTYLDERALLSTKENKSYTECIQNVHVDKIRLEENSIEESSVVEVEVVKPPKPIKNTHLEFVKLTDVEHDTLITKYGDDITDSFVERLNDYVGSTGKKYKSHYHTILSWLRKDKVQTLVEKNMPFDTGIEYD